MFQPQATILFSTAQTVLQDGLRAIQAGQTTFDLGRIESVDSAAVATLLAWQRAASAKGGRLQLLNIPSSLQGLIALYGVSELLPQG
jgi:phospholipid transport system transporter-binding protein